MKKILSVLLTILLMISLSPGNTYAKDLEMDEWLNEEFNPTLTKVLKGYNDVLEENWYTNLSYYLIKDEKDPTVEGLKSLRKELKSLTKEVKNISIPNAANKKEKKLIKASKKQLIKALNRTNKDAKRLIKRIKKEKSIEVISERKYEKGRITKVNEQYSKLNGKYDIQTKKLKLTNFIKINDDIAKNFINKEEKKREKEEAKLAAKAEMKAKKEAEEKRLAKEKAAADELERLKEEKKAAELQQVRVEQENETKWFQNCTELRKKYPNGVAQDHPAYQSKMDRDKDGWACER